MVERRVSSPQEIKEKYQKAGVVVFVLNQSGEILMVRENLNDSTTGKESGTFGVVCETSDEGEDWEETVIRGLMEELGISLQETPSVFRISPDSCFLGESLFVDGVLARVATVYFTGDSDKLLSTAGGGEVSIVGWEKPENLLSYPLRIGVRKILEECLEEGLIGRGGGVLEENLQPLSLINLRTMR